MDEPFEILSQIRKIETIATGRAVRSREYLKREYGVGTWRKMKVPLSSGTSVAGSAKRNFIGMKHRDMAEWK